jgi:GNAT superfamily N-acetyltransferase
LLIAVADRVQPGHDAGMRIDLFGASDLERHLDGFADILSDAVDSGASVSFMAPLGVDEARAYWRSLLPKVETGAILVLAAAVDGSGPVGTVQLHPAPQPNQPHRADIAKLLVHRRARRRGVAGALMRRVEGEALRLGRTLLMLDTVSGSGAERLYLSIGYVRFGVVPGHARLPHGPLDDTSFFYKQLAEAV